MSVAKVLSGVLLLGCGVLGYLFFQQNGERLRAEADAHSRIAGLERELHDARDSLVLLRKQQTERQPVHANTDAKPKQPGVETRRRMSISDIIKAHPEFASLYSNLIRRNVASVYGEGLSRLNLPKSQSDKIKSLLAEQQMAYIDAAQAAVVAGIKPLTSEWQEAVKQASTIGDDEIKSILGSDAPSILSDMKSDVGKAQAQAMLESQVRGIASDFNDANLPLGKDQSDGLTQALLKAYYWQGKDLSDRPVTYNYVDPSTGLSQHDVANMNNAAQVLSPDQLKVFRNYAIQMEKIYAIQKQYNLSLGFN